MKALTHSFQTSMFIFPNCQYWIMKAIIIIKFIIVIIVITMYIWYAEKQWGNEEKEEGEVRGGGRGDSRLSLQHGWSIFSERLFSKSLMSISLSQFSSSAMPASLLTFSIHPNSSFFETMVRCVRYISNDVIQQNIKGPLDYVLCAFRMQAVQPIRVCGLNVLCLRSVSNQEL